ncbi:hypothetical protein Mucpa_6835 [Mucilaginibacter paludis DSM 18603]|uniref:Uncharacterized protein n=1 Tax=Mucilaginibacter paludis DSM 18603 TaxID=714943 RepID=H1Y1L0_9SPHI|nr:hypothetical protein Mucpa_6835 [Mucilaginibacter paludis DSM 18603]
MPSVSLRLRSKGTQCLAGRSITVRFEQTFRIGLQTLLKLILEKGSYSSLMNRTGKLSLPLFTAALAQ